MWGTADWNVHKEKTGGLWFVSRPPTPGGWVVGVFAARGTLFLSKRVEEVPEKHLFVTVKTGCF